MCRRTLYTSAARAALRIDVTQNGKSSALTVQVAHLNGFLLAFPGMALSRERKLMRFDD
jgi:hypothetical protein